jgi:hypothetical protein
MTPLHHACASEHDNIEILKMLIDNAADVDVVNKAGESPLRVAINQKGLYSAKANYIRARGGKDIGPRAVQFSRSGVPPPPSPRPSSPPPPPPSPPPRLWWPQDHNSANHNIACDPNSSPDSNFPFPRNTSPDWFWHNSRLQGIADKFDALDDFQPAEFYGLSDADKETVSSMRREKARLARKEDERLLWGEDSS